VCKEEPSDIFSANGCGVVEQDTVFAINTHVPLTEHPIMEVHAPMECPRREKDVAALDSTHAYVQ
jgi:hypothetical protein